MTSSRLVGPGWVLLLALGGLLCAPSAATAQERPYTLGLVVRMLESGVPSATVLNDLRARCIDFRVDATAEEQLRAAGADAAFLSDVRSVCYRGAAEQTLPPARPSVAAAPSNVPGSPWGGFRMRALGYGGAMAAGAYLSLAETSTTSVVCEAGDCWNRTVTSAENRGLGMGLIAAAAAGAVIDLMLTSRRAGGRSMALRGGSAEGSLSRIKLAPPALAAPPGETRLELVRLRF
jgi:hypothetical protein